MVHLTTYESFSYLQTLALISTESVRTSNFLALTPSLSFEVVKVRMHGTSNPPWGKSGEYCLGPVTVQTIDPP